MGGDWEVQGAGLRKQLLDSWMFLDKKNFSNNTATTKKNKKTTTTPTTTKNNSNLDWPRKYENVETVGAGGGGSEANLVVAIVQVNHLNEPSSQKQIL